MAIVYQNDIAGKVCANPNCGWKPLSDFSPATLFGFPRGDGFKSRCKECMNAQDRAKWAADPEAHRQKERERVAKNKEHIQELKRKHQQKNPEKYQEYLKRYQASHREELNKKAKERRGANLEHARAIGRKAYERHAEERRQASREYFKLHPEKSVAANNRRRARKHQAGGSHTEQEWQELKAQYDYKCLSCGKREPEIQLTRDHIIPLEKGGDDSIENIQPLCARCNSKKSTRTIDYRNR